MKNNYNESRCAGLIDALYDCCAELYSQEGSGAKSTCCPKESLLKLKMKQRAEEKGGGGGGGEGGGAEIQQTRRR